MSVDWGSGIGNQGLIGTRGMERIASPKNNECERRTSDTPDRIWQAPFRGQAKI